MQKISNVTLLGGGVLGTQIAFHAAFKGFDVVIYDIDIDLFPKVCDRLESLKELYSKEIGATFEDVEKAMNNISFSFNLAEALENADLAIESIPENAKIKQDFYTEIGKIAPEKTIFTTNSSTMTPSSLMEYTGRPHKFLALHFANLLVRYNVAEIMRSPKTDDKSFDAVLAFAEKIGMVPIVVKKEQSRYILNSLLMPLLGAASELLLKGVGDIETIDKTWRVATGAPLGPFEIYDIVGLNTIYNIAKNGDMQSQMFGYYLKENFINKGKLGYLSGEGFYKYPKDGDAI